MQFTFDDTGLGGTSLHNYVVQHIYKQYNGAGLQGDRLTQCWVKHFGRVSQASSELVICKPTCITTGHHVIACLKRSPSDLTSALMKSSEMCKSKRSSRTQKRATCTVIRPWVQSFFSVHVLCPL